MSLKKIQSYPCQDSKFCHHPEHDPPNMIVLEPGLYEHTCPKCGDIFTFSIAPLK